MPQQNNIRFNLLLGWCCLLSVAMVIIAVVFATGASFQGQQKCNGEDKPTETIPLHYTAAAFRDPPFEHSLSNHVHLKYNKKSWVLSNSSGKNIIIFQNNLVKITATGLYYAYAQVTFMKKIAEGEETVSLTVNENIPDKVPRKLMEADKNNTGTVSMSQVIKLTRSYTVNLSISNNSMIFSNEASKTFWGLLLIAKIEDN